MNTNNIVMWVILPNNADWDCFKILTFREILKIQNPLLEEHYVFLEVIHTFVPISWMCKKHTAVSHSSTESEIISLDTGLRLDGLSALELWDLIVSVLGNVSRVSEPFQFYSLHRCTGKNELNKNQEKNVSQPNRDL